jgi:hypothetical protein
MTTLNLNSNSPNGQLNTLVTCIKCHGQNHADNMLRYGDAYICDFCQLDENEPIPYRVTLQAALDDCERKLNRIYQVLSDDCLMQAFRLFHAEGNHEAAKPFLNELLRRQSDAISFKVFCMTDEALCQAIAANCGPKGDPVLFRAAGDELTRRQEIRESLAELEAIGQRSVSDV